MGCWRTATGWVGAGVTPATGTAEREAEREAAATLTADLPEGATPRADKGYDVGAMTPGPSSMI